LKDVNKIYEKYKQISNMEEYLSYLNPIKNLHKSHLTINYNSKEKSRSSRNEQSIREENNFQKQTGSYYNNYSYTYLNRKRGDKAQKYQDSDNSFNQDNIKDSNTRSMISYDDLN